MSASRPTADGASLELATIGQALGCPLTPAQVETLERFEALLLRWNQVYNLTAIREAAAVRTQHIADCLAVVQPLRHQLGARLAQACAGGPPLRLLDVGSGGGLPGVVLAIAMPPPALEVTCVDAVGKKVAFVQQAAAELGLSGLHGVHARVETLKAPVFDVIASRAFATLADFVRLTRPSLAPHGVWMAMKGKPPDDEIARLPRDVTVFHVEPLAVPGSGAQRCIVWMKPGGVDGV